MSETGTFRNRDGLTIFTQKWRIPSPKGVILLVHGIGEHSSRYLHVAQALNGYGFSVYALDHRGHGKSEGVRTYFESFDEPVNDLKQYLDAIKEENPSLPVFVYGHSMGSLISTLFCLKYQKEVKGFISSGSPLGLSQTTSPTVMRVAGGISKFLPKARILLLPSHTLSRDPLAVQAYDADPLVDRKMMRIGMAYRLISAAKGAVNNLNTLVLPLLVLHGTADTLTPALGSEILYEQAGSTDKTVKWYDGLFHEIHNEPEKQQVFSDVGAWLTARV